MASEEARKLRAEVQKKLISVNNKIARTQKNTGAKVAGSEFDPRRRAGIDKNYNVAQLRSYLNDLNAFMRRPNQFVAGSRGAPIPRGKYAAFQKLQKEYSEVAKSYEASVGNNVLPKEFDNMTVRAHKGIAPESQGSTVYGPYRKYDYASTDIKNVGALEKLANKIKSMLKRGYLEKEISEGRENLEKALTIMGEGEWIERIDQLSDYQFDVLWNGTEFADRVFAKYDLLQERKEGTRKEKWQDKVVDSQFAELGGLFDWASNLPTERPTT